MQDRKNLNACVFETVHNNVRGSGDDQLARAIDPSCSAFLGEQTQAIDRFEHQIQLPIRRCNTIRRDVPMDFSSFRFGQRCPMDVYWRAQVAIRLAFSAFVPLPAFCEPKDAGVPPHGGQADRRPPGGCLP
jgi:hypothetical protein